jgi:type VI secretion system secreted protein VgrG
VCSAAQQTQVERAGLSTYELRIVPALWLLTQRTNHRVFQHASVPEIGDKLLREWGIPAAWHVDRSAHPRLEYRVQHGESDFAFLSRLLEEAGIAYTFGEGDGPAVSFFDAIESSEPRPGGPLPFEDQPNAGAQREFVTGVRIAHEVRPGRLTLRDFDFRRKPDIPLFAAAGSPEEARLEQHLYWPGSFFAEGARPGDTPVADDKGVSRAQEKVGKEQAERALAAARSSQRHVAFGTNAIDLRPGTVFSIAGHAHGDLAPGHRLLVTELRIEGAHDSEWTIEGSATLADVPYRPPRTTPKPVVQGVESAVVVGPPGEEIFTDELGRVRVQFPWDREGDFDDDSSCWIRVSQGWAGAGYGMIALPRVGQEVVVGFFGGDPDQPILVGRVFNNTARVPNKLPESRTQTTWRSASSPGGDGWNEITFEDAKGRERLFVQAERDLEKIVKANESEEIGGSATRRVAGSETVEIGAAQTILVGAGRSVAVGGDDEITVGLRHAVTIAPGADSQDGLPPTGLEVANRKIILSTGEATLTLEGPNITLEAAASILLNAAASITVTGRADIRVAAGASVSVQAQDGDLILRGGPDVHVNPTFLAEDEADDLEPLPVEAPPGADVEEDVGEAEEHLWFQPDDPSWLEDRLAPGGDWDPAKWGPQHVDFGYFRLGLLGSAAGIPEGVLLRQAGQRTVAEKGASEERGDPGNGLWGGKRPYGNEPRQYEMMKKGAGYFRRNFTPAGDGEDGHVA